MKRLVLALLVVCAGCMSSHEPETEVEAYAPLPFAEVGRGAQALVDTVHRVILSGAEWVAYQDSLRPLIPFTPVDFDFEMVVVAAIPVQRGGYDLRFEEFEDSGDVIIARYRLYMPGQDCRPTVGTGNAFQVVRMVQSDKPVAFERLEEALDCTDF